MAQGKVYIRQHRIATRTRMYQEWESPTFTIERLTELCEEFFRSNEFATQIDRKSKKKVFIKVEKGPGLSHTLMVEQKGSKLKLTFPPISHSTMGLATLEALVVTGRGLRNVTEKQLVLDRIEEQFWEYMDRNLAELHSEGI